MKGGTFCRHLLSCDAFEDVATISFVAPGGRVPLSPSQSQSEWRRQVLKSILILVHPATENRCLTGGELERYKYSA